ncbi:MAG: 16S rRNA (guanine(527)-N(7))-methyltransferase RsmG [Neomegalonema sp.]|nr:16S rRNA (guanine(527)-N(7))-methyltransferase RsmG [Neomegalonema sp.]
MSGLDPKDRARGHVQLLEALNVSRETLERLNHFAALLEKWNQRINLVSPRDMGVLWQRHICDCAGLSGLALPGRHWLDIGSGGGFPGLVLAVLAKDAAPERAFTLVDSDKRKTAFLVRAIAELELNAVAKAARIEDLTMPPPDIITGRALAPVDRLLSWTENLRGIATELALLKGRQVGEELTDAEANWHIEKEVLPNPFSEDGQILRIRRASRRI